MRVLIYNSSARGSGQFVRSLKVAGVIAESFRDAQCTILAGNSLVERSVPERTVVVPLPQIRKSLAGEYLVRPTHVSGARPVLDDVTQAFAVRRRMIGWAMEEWEPDVVLVDSRPEGLNDELLDVLRQRRCASKCRNVLMLRDIVDDPALVTRRWAEHGTYANIRDLYDDVVIWGDEQIFDAVAAYDLSPFRKKVTYLGYLGSAQPVRAVADVDAPAAVPGRILVTVGGGFDGAGVIRTVCDYIGRAWPGDSSLHFTIVLGAHSPMTVADVTSGRCEYGKLEVYGHVPDLDALISEADVVVSMCGYNTLLELIERRRKIVAVPRSHSGAEQTMRAHLLEGLYDGMWVIPENDLTASTFERALQAALRSASPTRQIEMKGAASLSAFLRPEVLLA